MNPIALAIITFVDLHDVYTTKNDFLLEVFNYNFVIMIIQPKKT